jgi:hypothetical protein
VEVFNIHDNNLIQLFTPQFHTKFVESFLCFLYRICLYLVAAFSVLNSGDPVYVLFRSHVMPFF